MKLVIVISLIGLAAVIAEERGGAGKSRVVPNYKARSASYETTTADYASTPAYATKTTTEASYQEEPIYRKSTYSTPARPSYTTSESYVAETTPYPKSEPATYTSTPASTYTTEEKTYTKTASYYGTTEPVSYSTKPTYAEPKYSTPAYGSPARYSAPVAYSKKESYDYKPMPYKFAWGVKDAASYNDYSHQQESDGKVTTGSYRVLLPDGRTQIVTYKADENGYVADVKYEGEAKYVEYKPTYKPAYTKAAKYEEDETKYADDYKPLISYSSTKAPAGYTTTKPTYSATQAYSTKSYEAPTYTTPSYQASKY